MKRRKKTIPETLTTACKTRDNNRCRICGIPDFNLQCDHIVPESLGGETALDNLQTLCSTCNNSKGNDDAVEYPIMPSIEEDWTPEMVAAWQVISDGIRSKRSAFSDRLQTLRQTEFKDRCDAVFASAMRWIDKGNRTSTIAKRIVKSDSRKMSDIIMKRIAEKV